MGLSYLREHAAAAGLTARVLDLNERVYTLGGDALRAYWEMDHARALMSTEGAGPIADAMAEAIDRILAAEVPVAPRAVGFSTYHLNTALSVQIARSLRPRWPETAILFGGPSMLETAERRKVPADLPAAVVMGEAEERLSAIVGAIARGEPVPDLPGVARGEAIHAAKTRDEALVVDEQNPALFPRYPQMPLESYQKDYLPILMARGCPFACAFCNDQFAPYRRRAVASIVDEMRHHAIVHGVTEFFFCDQSLDASVRHLDAVMDALLAERFAVRWWGQLNVKKGLTPELLAKMKRSGCTNLSWGVESLADAVLRRVKKPSTGKLAEQVLKDARAAGIGQLVYLIAGLPGETDKTHAETLSRLRRIAPYVDRFSIMPAQISPFSPLEAEPEKYGVRLVGDDPKNDWVSADGTNTPAARERWLTELIETLLELGVPFQSPILNKARYMELLGREVEGLG